MTSIPLEFHRDPTVVSTVGLLPEETDSSEATVQMLARWMTLADRIRRNDRESLDLIDSYVGGDHRDPYMPQTADLEYKMLARRSVTNLIPMVIAAPVQMLYVDNGRRKNENAADGSSTSMAHWQRSSMDQRQVPLYEAACQYGQAYVITQKDADGKIRSYGLSPKRAIGLISDPSRDLHPKVLVHFRSDGYSDSSGEGRAVWVDGIVEVWDRAYYYKLRVGSKGDLSVESTIKHGAKECPATRFAVNLDLDGNVSGLVLDAIPIQDRINQTTFDLLVAQTYTSFEVRTATGMAPPLKKILNEETGKWELAKDDQGQPVVDRQYLNASRWMYAENPDVRFSSLPGGALDGFLSHLELAVRQLSALKQIPPHYLLGQIANISAEALQAAQNSLLRLVVQLQHSFGESWERVFIIAAQIDGEKATEDYLGEVVWRDMSATSLAQSADALGKFATLLDIPKRGLWARVPGVSSIEIDEWNRLREEDKTDTTAELDINGMMARSVVDSTMRPAPPSPPGGGVLRDPAPIDGSSSGQ